MTITNHEAGQQIGIKPRLPELPPDDDAGVEAIVRRMLSGKHSTTWQNESHIIKLTPDTPGSRKFNSHLWMYTEYRTWRGVPFASDLHCQLCGRRYLADGKVWCPATTIAHWADIPPRWKHIPPKGSPFRGGC